MIDERFPCLAFMDVCVIFSRRKNIERLAKSFGTVSEVNVRRVP
eukprot:SAG25_NODE_10041_length_347_cov_19.562780_1_plen_43_part_10